MSTTEPPHVAVARDALAEFTQADRTGWDRDDYAYMAHRLAGALKDTLAAYIEATGGQS